MTNLEVLVNVAGRGPEFFFCPTPRFLSANLSNKARMLFCRNHNKQSLRCTIFQFVRVSQDFFANILDPWWLAKRNHFEKLQNPPYRTLGNQNSKHHLKDVYCLKIILFEPKIISQAHWPSTLDRQLSLYIRWTESPRSISQCLGRHGVSHTADSSFISQANYFVEEPS